MPQFFIIYNSEEFINNKTLNIFESSFSWEEKTEQTTIRILDILN